MDGLGKAEEKRHRRRIWLLVLAPIAAIIVVAGAVAGIWFATGRAELNEAVADLEAAGIPTKISEIIPPPVPDAENAAVRYEKAWTLLGEIPDDAVEALKAPLTVPLSQLPEGRRQILVNYLESKRPAIHLAEQASKLSKCRFDLDYSEGVLIRLPQLSKMMRLAQFLQADAAYKLEGGDFSGAVDSALAMRAIGRHCGSGLLFMCKLAEFACYNRSADALDTILTNSNPSQEQLERLLSRVEQEAPEPGLATAFQSEICLGIDAYARIRAGSLSLSDLMFEDGDDGDRTSAWLRWVADRDEALYLAAMVGYLELSDKPYFEARPSADAIETEVERASPLLCPLAKIITPALGGAFAAANAVETRHQLQRFAVASMIYEKRHGRLPKNLDELAPGIIAEVPVDPFSGKPYVYRREDGGFVIYSLDRNMKDDGGVSSRDVGKDKGDLVFRYSRPD